MVCECTYSQKVFPVNLQYASRYGIAPKLQCFVWANHGKPWSSIGIVIIWVLYFQTKPYGRRKSCSMISMIYRRWVPRRSPRTSRRFMVWGQEIWKGHLYLADFKILIPFSIFSHLQNPSIWFISLHQNNQKIIETPDLFPPNHRNSIKNSI